MIFLLFVPSEQRYGIQKNQRKGKNVDLEIKRHKSKHDHINVFLCNKNYRFDEYITEEGFVITSKGSWCSGSDNLGYYGR